MSIYRRLKKLLQSEYKTIILLPDRYHYSTQIDNFTLENSVVAVYNFFSKLSSVNVTVLTNNPKAEIFQNLIVCDILEEIKQLNIDEITDSFNEMQQSSLEEKEAFYEEHLSKQDVRFGVESGQLISGIFRASRFSAEVGSVLVFSGDSKTLKIEIEGLQNVNRAIDGDLVAVERIDDTLMQDKIQDAGIEAEEEKSEEVEAEIFSESEMLEEYLNNELDKKKVVQLKKNLILEGGILKGKVVSVLRRASHRISGSFRLLEDESGTENARKKVVFLPLQPHLPKILVSTSRYRDLKTKRLVVQVDDWDISSRWPRGHLVEVIGEIGDKETEAKVVLQQFDIRESKFSEKVLRCLPDEGWSVQKEIEKNGLGSRADFRGLPICSIDPPNCKDIDDALHAKNIGENLFEVGVHIADVSNYVLPGSEVDIEARERGTSTYLVDRRLDMLPGRLTTDICSLKEKVERFAFSVIWELEIQDDKVVVRKFKATKSVIFSKKAFAYQQAQEILDGKVPRDLITGKEVKVQNDIVESITILNRIAKLLRLARMNNGALTLASPEVKFSLDESNSNPKDVKPYDIYEANHLVEEMMLLANISVARKLVDSSRFKKRTLLRRHGKPNELLEDLKKLVATLGYTLRTGNSKELGESLDKIKSSSGGETDKVNNLVRIMATRCMNRAQYICSGDFSKEEFQHYGLGSEIYTHFTSPIRRYADLEVHRLLADLISDEVPVFSKNVTQASLRDLSENLNSRHYNAQLAGRASVKLYTVLFFKSNPQSAQALVSQVNENGSVLVFIPKFGIEEKISLKTKKDEKIEYDATRHELTKKTETREVKIKVFDEITVHLSSKEARNRGLKLVLAITAPQVH
eukprot:augustus_masked-scaffold_20-processed-gene-4.3-mRNA-1 protein AED:0.06 eAED:0.06 QI:0/-1/0/1/-1/1/1/0/861